jgi:hypothetical protein
MSRSLQLGLRSGELFQTPSVPRSCSVQINKLELKGNPHDTLKGKLDPKLNQSRDEPNFSLAFQTSSRRVLVRVDEFPVSSGISGSDQNQPETTGNSEIGENPINVTFEYQHFTKNRQNNLHIILQKRKKYRARVQSGFKSIARGQINLDEIVQRPPDKFPLCVKLFQNEKDSKETKQIEIGSIQGNLINES